MNLTPPQIHSYLEIPPLKLDSLEQLQPILVELAENFNRAEQKATEVGEELNELVVPAINQLRYVGFHLSNVFKTIRFEGQSVKISHCGVVNIIALV